MDAKCITFWMPFPITEIDFSEKVSNNFLMNKENHNEKNFESK